MIYYVKTLDTTPDEPSAGWYFEQDEVVRGPYPTKERAQAAAGLREEDPEIAAAMRIWQS